MKIIIRLLKFLMYFITAIWGMVLGLLIPVSLLILVDYSEVKFNPAPIVWLVSTIAGYIVPCFLVKFNRCKTAAALTLAGAGGILFVYNALPTNWWTYIPLLLETAAVVVIAILTGIEKKKESDDKPAPSILERRDYKD